MPSKHRKQIQRSICNSNSLKIHTAVSAAHPLLCNYAHLLQDPILCTHENHCKGALLHGALTVRDLFDVSTDFTPSQNHSGKNSMKVWVCEYWEYPCVGLPLEISRSGSIRHDIH